MDLRYWLFLAGVLVLTAGIGYNTYLSAQLLQRWRPDRNLLLLPAETLLRLALIGVCIGLGWLSGLDRTALGWVWLGGIRPWLVGTAWGVALAAFFMLTTLGIVRWTGRRFYSSTIVRAIIPQSGWELIAVSLAMILVVLLEELLFRSLLLGGLAPLAPMPLLVIGWSVLFGLLHSPQGLWGMIGAGLAGGLLSLLFLQSGSLLVPWIAHYVANMVQVVQAMRDPSALQDELADPG
jgi:membrane protease YdiL (CAAX protease family)